MRYCDQMHTGTYMLVACSETSTGIACGSTHNKVKVTIVRNKMSEKIFKHDKFGLVSYVRILGV